MKKTFVILFLLMLTFPIIVCSKFSGNQKQKKNMSEPVSGEIVNGYRILNIKKGESEFHFSVFRGDYVQFNLFDYVEDPLIHIDALNIHDTLSAGNSTNKYFKMKTAGKYKAKIGRSTGEITVLNFTQLNYKELTTEEIEDLIQTKNPLILDVRTEGEYRAGHLANSILIPLNELQSRTQELERYKNQDILIYCRSGNRSTVASKILVDLGFNRVYNMRTGIVDWIRQGKPIIK